MKILLTQYPSITHNIARVSASDYSIEKNLTIDSKGVIRQILVFDWESDGTVGVVPIYVEFTSSALTTDTLTSKGSVCVDS